MSEENGENNFKFKFDFSDRTAVDACLKYFSTTKNGNPVLSLNDFKGVIQSIFADPKGEYTGVSEEMVNELFTVVDVNRDGKVDTEGLELFGTKFIKPLVQPVTALLVIDMQNDFVEGSLALKCCPAKQDAKGIIPVINNLIENNDFDVVAYTLDCHPEDHISFFENLKYYKLKENNKSSDEISVFDTVLFDGTPEIKQTLWPVHCVQNTWGCELHKDLRVKQDSLFVYKGQQKSVDSYSAFFDNMNMSCTILHDELRKRNVSHVFVCGVALDYCVAFTALDALKLGYATIIVEDGTAGTDDDNIKVMKEKLASNHCVFSSSHEIKNLIRGTDRRSEFASVFLKSLRKLG